MHPLLRSLLSFLDNSSSSSTAYSHSFSSSRRTSSQKTSDSYAYILAQLLPLLILLGLPALALLARARTAKLFRRVYMVFGSLLGWWGASPEANSVANGEKEERGRRRRADGVRKVKNTESTDSSKDEELEEEDDSSDEDLHYPGLVNISGTYCFLNSVLQAMASLAYLQPHLEAIHARAVELDVHSPVVDTLQDTLQTLNTPKSTRSSHRPVPMINALSQPARGARSKLFASREHQDAQELFQLLSECIKSEAHAVDAEAQRDRGLGGFASSSSAPSELAAQGVFDGLTANRRSCVGCGYTEAVMHFAFATWSLALPSAGYGGACALQECLGEYTRLEVLTDCVCRRCSMRATYVRVKEEAERLQEVVNAAAAPGGGGASQYRKKKAREARRTERAVKAAIEEGRIEEDVKGVKMERVVSAASTKQAMIARPPKILVLHLNRSLHFGGPHSSRNPIRVRFPEILDLTPYTTSGQLSTAPSLPISAPAPPLPRCTTPTQGLYATPRVLYRLSAVVVHYGQHSFGHYVCFRRKPRVGRGKEEKEGTARPSVPVMPCPYGCDCKLCTNFGPVRDAGAPPRAPRVGKGWLRISDAEVEECGLERVLAEGSGAFLLFYERVQSAGAGTGVYGVSSVGATLEESRLGMGIGGVDVGVGVGVGAGAGGVGSVYQHLYARGTPRSSEETVRPADAVSLSRGKEGDGEDGGGYASPSPSVSSGGLMRPRVVRRTTAGRRERGRSAESGRAGSGVGVGAGASGGVGSLPSSLELPKVKTKEAKEEEDKTDVSLGHGTANGSAVPPADEHSADESLSESIVKVELPSPPRTPSPYSSPRKASIPIPSIQPNHNPNSSLPKSQDDLKPINDARIDSPHKPPQTQAPRTPSPSPSHSPVVSPSSSRKSAQSRIPRPRGASSSSSPSKSASASHGGDSGGGSMLPDRTPVGLRA